MPVRKIGIRGEAAGEQGIMAEDTDRLYRKASTSAAICGLPPSRASFPGETRRKSHINKKSRQRVSFTTDLSEQSKESSRLLLREKGDRADFHGVEYRVVDEEILCVMDTSSVIATLALPSRDATFPYWGRQ